MNDFVWNFKGMNAGGPTLSQAGAQGMQGYVPVNASVPGQQMAPNVPRAPQPFDAQGYGRSLDAASLMAEYRANEARIAELESQLAEIDRKWTEGAGMRERAALDDLDRRLAVSRAKYGDIAGAVGHLNRIDSRALANRKDEDERKTKLKTIVTELENAYIMRNAEKEATAQAGWDNKIARLSKEYQELTGQPYAYTGANLDTGVYGAGSRPANFLQYNSKLTSMKGMRKDGRLTEKQVAELFADLGVLPNGAEKDAATSELAKTMYDSAEVHDRKVATYRSKVKKAVNDFIADGEKKFDSETKKKMKKEGGETTVTRNGVTLTIKYVGTRGGKKTYEVWADGKKQSEYTE